MQVNTTSGNQFISNANLSSGSVIAFPSPTDTQVNKSQFLKSIEPLTERYKGFLLDQFGVLHDGDRPFAKARDAVESAYLKGIKTIIVSNSASPSAKTQEKLAAMGFDPKWFHDVITSGEIGPSLIREYCQHNFPDRNEPLKVLHTTLNDISTTEFLGDDFQACSDGNTADLVIIQGVEAKSTATGVYQQTFAQLEQFVTRAAERGVPAFCINPDTVCSEGGKIVPMPGKLAQKYSELALKSGYQNVMHYVGKPHQAIYERALQKMAEIGIEKESVVGIGDGPATDVLGAQNNSIDSVFILGGIEAEQFGLSFQADQVNQQQEVSPNLTALPQVLEQNQVKKPPTYVVPYFA